MEIIVIYRIWRKYILSAVVARRMTRRDSELCDYNIVSRGRLNYKTKKKKKYLKVLFIFAFDKTNYTDCNINGIVAWWWEATGEFAFATLRINRNDIPILTARRYNWVSYKKLK